VSQVVVVRGVVVGHLLVSRLWPGWQKITSLRKHHKHRTM
jgi:hypothetical protein